MKKSITLIVFVATLFMSCNKKDTATKKELLTAHCWIMSEATVDPAILYQGVLITNAYGLLPLCNRDNIVCILENGRVYVDEGIQKCNLTDPQVNASAKWWFNADETVLLYVNDGSTDTIHSELLELDKDHLRVRQTVDLLGEPRNVTFAYEPE